MAGHHSNPRRIKERISISGELQLLTPAHFGSGRTRGDALVDMSLLLDDAEGSGRALIPGATIAGALRNYLREQVLGYTCAESNTKATAISSLFGPPRQARDRAEGSGDALNWDQSLLIVDDALVRPQHQNLTLRDGVRINPDTGTAYIETQSDDREAGAKFDLELLEAGAIFDLHFEVLATECNPAAKVLPYVVAALQGLENGDIRLGLRKRRGYGRCRIMRWTVSHYDLTQAADLCTWLETATLAHRADAKSGEQIGTLLEAAPPQEADQRRQFKLSATFALAGSSLLIRSGFGEADSGPDMEHLHALAADGQRVPVVSGTSWAGIMRHRALRIVNTLAEAHDGATARAAELVDTLFGSMPKDQRQPRASRVTVDETQVHQGQHLYQTRVRIDRFTGGAFPTGLFEQAPIYGRPETVIDFALHVRDPQPHEIGLLLLVLKDLWTSDLPIGGEASVGRGRLQGIRAELALPAGELLQLDQGKPALGATPEDRILLQGMVDALWNQLHQPVEEPDAAYA
jgi:CRISPR/Cas system CSM-associated protein Csm3 (group 7 of RAMP superfamily)